MRTRTCGDSVGAQTAQNKAFPRSQTELHHHVQVLLRDAHIIHSSAAHAARPADYESAVLGDARSAVCLREWFAPAGLKAAIYVNWYPVYRITAAL